MRARNLGNMGILEDGGAKAEASECKTERTIALIDYTPAHKKKERYEKPLPLFSRDKPRVNYIRLNSGCGVLRTWGKKNIEAEAAVSNVAEWAKAPAPVIVAYWKGKRERKMSWSAENGKKELNAFWYSLKVFPRDLVSTPVPRTGKIFKEIHRPFPHPRYSFAAFMGINNIFLSRSKRQCCR